MKIVWVIVVVFAVMIGIGVMVFFAIFGRMIFADKIAERETRELEDLYFVDPGFQVTELEHSLAPLPYEYSPNSGDVAAAKAVLLTPENTVKEGQVFFEGDPNRELLMLEAAFGHPDKIFDGNTIFRNNNGYLGKPLHDLDNPRLGTLRYVAGINSDWFLLAGDPEGSPYTNTKLWQVSHHDYSREPLSDDPYFTFSRRPRVFTPKEFAGTVLVYYSGDIHFGFGGDSSRPETSTVRLYSDAFPSGRDMVQLSLRAGTIVDVKVEGDTLVLYGDPSRPGVKHRLPPRLWRVTQSDSGVAQ